MTPDRLGWHLEQAAEAVEVLAQLGAAVPESVPAFNEELEGID
jgi:hypothetical protein